jgi:histidinol-phosphate aminotransferase
MTKAFEPELVSRRRLANPSILAIRPYQPGKPISEVQRELGIRDVVKLASNENPLGPSPRAIAAMQALLAELHFYPESGGELRQALAARHGVSADCIALGNGGTELLGVIARTFLSPGEELLCPHPTFPWYAMLGQQLGARNVLVPLADGVVDLAALAARITERTKLVFLANPNNPTGTALPRAAIDAFVAALPEHVVLVLDEAYVDFLDDEGEAPDVRAYLGGKPVIALRTFSKIAGLAGIRIAYAIAEPELIGLLEKVAAPFSTTKLAQAAAVAALGDDEHRARSRLLARDGRRFLSAELARLGVRHLPSQANFVFADFQAPIEPISQALLRRGMVVRPMLETCARITVGTAAQNAGFVCALEQVLTERGSSAGPLPVEAARAESHVPGR